MKWLLYGLALFAPGPLWATATVCDLAAEQASAETGVPLALLQAITRVETGRDGAPWPWTLNIDGDGFWFDTTDGAIAAAETALTHGAQQVDIGCFQLNHRWHGAAFADLVTMIDPLENARYAARFLTDLYAETGDWRSAAAAYHSRSPDRGDAYVERLESAHDRALPSASPAQTDAATALPPHPRANGYPLLLAGQAGGAGSLVPAGRGLSPLIGGP